LDTAVSLTTTGRHAPGRVERCVYRSEAPIEPAVKPAVEAAAAAVKIDPELNLLGYVREGFLGTRANDGCGRSRCPAQKPNSTGNESRYHKVSHHSLHGSYNETTVSLLSFGKAASS